MTGDRHWIGVDIGGTWVRAVRIVATADGYQTAGAPQARAWKPAEFAPQSLAAQLAGAARDAAECAAADALVLAITEAVAAVVARDASPARVAICSAGPKTADARGIACWLNGPRVPALLDEVRAASRVDTITWPARIDDDLLAGAKGEVAGVHGTLRALAVHEHALYLAIGTGVAEAWVAGDCVQALPLPPAHELRDPAAPDADLERASFDARAGLRACAQGASLDAVWAAAERLVQERRYAFAERGTQLACIALGGKGAELFAERAPTLAGVPVRFSAQPLAPAIGTVALALEGA